MFCYNFVIFNKISRNQDNPAASIVYITKHKGELLGSANSEVRKLAGIDALGPDACDTLWSVPIFRGSGE
jgi:hypothetical protein